MTASLSAALRLLSPRAAPRRGLFLLITTALGAIVALFAVLTVDAHTDARRAAESSEVNLATALARDVDRNVELLDLSIQAARDAWADPRVRALDPEMRQMVVFDHSATARYIDTILVVDREGTVVADSRSTVPRAANLADRDFFAAQKARNAGLFIGRPMQISGKDGWHIAFSRRMTADDGGFGGVAVGILNLDYLSSTYQRLPLGLGGVMVLFNTDGTLLVREPEQHAAVGRSFLGQPVFSAMTSPEGGAFEAVSTLDRQDRIYAYHRVGSLPLIQGVGVTADTVYAGWRAKTLSMGCALGGLCLGILALLFVLKGELQQRAAAEAALDALASTDHLTGLLNRRKFFELAEPSLAAAHRDGRAVSVLMIDADQFKGYNDRYGHIAGDRVLAAVGRCIGGEVRREADLAARYGGEEFIALLPGLGRAGAYVVAEAIRTAIARLAMPHDRSTAGIVTVSTGLGSSEPGAPLDLRALVEAADAELYRAKRDGRNRSSGGERVLARAARPPDALSA